MSTVILKPSYPRGEVHWTAPSVQQGLSWALMLPFLFLVDHGTFSFQSTGVAVGGFSPGGVATRDPGVFGYVFAAVAYLMMAWFIRSKLTLVISLAGHFKMLTLLALLAVFSAVWSQSPPRSLLYGILYLLGTLFGYYLVIRFETEEIMGMMTRLGLIVSILSLLMVIFLPDFGLTHGDLRNGVGWQGIFTDRTGAAKALVYLISPAFISRGKRSIASWLMSTCLMALMIVMAHAVTAIFVLFIYIVFLFVLRISRKVDSRLMVMTVIAGGLVAVLALFLGLEYGSDLLKVFGRSPTLTGRTEIWSALAISILKRPLLGYGYFAFWQGIKGESGKVILLTHWTFGYAHNGIIEIFLQLGSVGVIVFFITLFKAVKDAWFCYRNDRSGAYDWYLGLLVITIFYNIDEATVFFPNDLLSVLYVVMCCGLAMGAKRLRQGNERGLIGGMTVITGVDRSQMIFGKNRGSLARSAAKVLRQDLAYLIYPLWNVPLRALVSYIFGRSYKQAKYQRVRQELLS
jgi:exopolysaccharide production protein ExoQ